MANQDELRKGKGEGGYTSRVSYSMYLSRLKKDYGGKRCVFNEERNKGKVEQDRSGKGREFQMDGATNGKECRPFCRPNIRDCEEELVKGS